MPAQQPAAQPPETVSVATDALACDGNGEALGHPRVYLTMNKFGYVDCPYCGKRYVKCKAKPL